MPNRGSPPIAPSRRSCPQLQLTIIIAHLLGTKGPTNYARLPNHPPGVTIAIRSVTLTLTLFTSSSSFLSTITTSSLLFAPSLCPTVCLFVSLGLLSPHRAPHSLTDPSIITTPPGDPLTDDNHDKSSPRFDLSPLGKPKRDS